VATIVCFLDILLVRQVAGEDLDALAFQGVNLRGFVGHGCSGGKDCNASKARFGIDYCLCNRGPYQSCRTDYQDVESHFQMQERYRWIMSIDTRSIDAGVQEEPL
jgi:hypothetical protein